ncbi:unnamed protein product [Allacma fusca]|uniref:AAA+ ATPase domain-containing protein n=1 Tax=Allacma fusca TaxID=39272 RepID=A0A8J2NN61_9HEXA|nr:unnamed protein product [Allacma fusca]
MSEEGGPGMGSDDVPPPPDLPSVPERQPEPEGSETGHDPEHEGPPPLPDGEDEQGSKSSKNYDDDDLNESDGKPRRGSGAQGGRRPPPPPRHARRESKKDSEKVVQDEDDEDPDFELRSRRPSEVSASSKPSQANIEGIKTMKKSVMPHMQAEQNKMKIAKYKHDRENRRAALEMHHMYLIEYVATHLDLKPKEVEEFVIDSPDYLALMDQFFDKKGSKSIFFYYQITDPPGPESGRPVMPGSKKEKIKRVLISNGADIPIRGIVMFFIRLNTNNRITVKSIADDIFFGQLDVRDPNEAGVVLETVNDMLNTVFLKNLQVSTTWMNIPDPELAARIRHKFITSIEHYGEFLKDSFNDIQSRLDLRQVSNVDEIYEAYLRTPESTIQAAKNPQVVAKVEQVVISWCKNIERVLALSKQMRKETDVMGPLAELAYWRNLVAKMCYIIQQVQEWKFINFIQVLVHSKSKVLRRWKDVDSRVTDEYHEAKDNVRYMYALEKFCQPLYQCDPPSMIEHIASMMYTIRTIHTTSRYYNSCEKVTALMIKISNQMVSACKLYLTNAGKDTVWSQDKRVMVTKLKDCIQLYNTYYGTYESTRIELEDNPDGKVFNFSKNHIFGRFEKFCERLKKIIQILEIFDMYSFIHESHIDGMDVISLRLNNLQKNILKKTNDPLEFRESDFDNDYVSIRNSVDEIQKALEAFMDKSIENCPTALHGLILLQRFANLRNRCLDIEAKQVYLFQFYHNEIDMLKGVYDAEKNDTPTPRGYPPFAGKLAWATHLYKRLERGMSLFEKETNILKRDEAKPTIKNYNSLAKKLVFYEILFHDAWVKQANSVYDALEAPILTLRGTIRQELVLNYDPFFKQLIEETEIIRKMDLEIPDVAQIVYFRQAKLMQTYEEIKTLLERFLMTKTKIPPDLMVLVRTMVKKVEKAFMPGVSTINWTSLKTGEYFEYIDSHLKELEAIVAKINEIISLRINQILYDISHTMMTDIPESTPMPVLEYLDKIRKYGAIVSKDLEYKSRACESAVIELINMLLANCDLNVPDELLFSWMNPNILQPPAGHGKRANMGLLAVINSLSPSAKEDLLSLHEECRHVFGFYSQKCLEALQKTTRISLDILRKRTEEPQISKRQPEKQVNRIPLFTADLILAIPVVQVKPPLEDAQMILGRSIQLVVESLKRVVIWGQTRRSSFDMQSQEAYYKDTSKLPENEAQPYERLMAQEQMVRQSIQMDNVNSKLKNCYKPVMEYKDISKMVLMMQTVVMQAKPKVSSLINKYMAYQYLWKEDRDDEVQQIIDSDPVITEIQAIWRRYGELEEDITNIPASHRAGPLQVHTEEMKQGLLIEVKAWKNALCKALSEKYKMKTLQISKFIDEANKDLSTPIKDMNDIRFVMTVQERIRENFVTHDAMLTPIEEAYSFLNSKDYRVPEEESNRADTLRLNYNKLLTRASEIQEKINSVQDANRRRLAESVVKFQADLKKYVVKYEAGGPMVEGLAPQDASDRLVTFQDEFDELFERYTMCNAGEKLFGLPEHDYPALNKLNKELALLQKLYGLFNDVMKAVNGYYDIKWSDLDIQKINGELTEFQNRCRRLPKALKDWPAFQELKKKIDDFNETCPLLELMTNKSMKDRHWERIGDVVNHRFEIDNENFSLKHVMEAPLLKYKDEVEDICLGATKEKDIEAKMKQIVQDFSIVQLSFSNFKNRGEMLLKGQETSEIMTQLEDSLMILNYLFNNRYSALYRKEIQSHLTDFSNTSQILENWLAVQNLWIYLEAVFVGGDIARQMPLEAKRFQNIDRTWVKIMNRAREIILVVPTCVGDETMGQLLPHLLEQLELCQKSLSGYLESKRKIFPRFFFVSDPVLLEILGQASDAHTIQPHLLSIFENVDDIDWHVKEYNKMLGVISKEGEKITFDEFVTAEGNVEVWLGNLLDSQRKNLQAVIRDASYSINATDFDLLDFLATYIAQVDLLGLQLIWTRDAEKALSSARRDKKIMKTTNEKFNDMLSTLIAQTTKNLSKYERLKYETLITIHVHQKDIFEDLYKANVKSVNDFEWLKQCRFHFIFERDKCLVKVTDINFEYQNEALGNTERLVITPLTDRCYITIAQAIGCSLGAAPAGPAGTGKTETSKDMAKALGKYCVVFNCSDQMDFRGLGRIFKGLAQSGSWGCFDEFNRIELPVLSVAAQQIHLVLSARRENKESFIFSDGDTVDLSREVGLIITMNPGYAGRQELPENLKVQFRSIAMIVPDRMAIIRVKLAACGFLQNVVLARKFFILYRLCEEQLSKQVHYDFGLRNILSVLRTLGFQKRSRPKDAEETVVMSVLRDMNLSKLADEDEGLFISLIKDLFPGVNLESVTHDELQAAIAEEVEKAKLINYPSWSLKVIQFFETSLVRHGLMALGPTGAGKTCILQTLMKALTLMEIPHKEVRMNPKAITAAQMFGRLDVATNDWTDGIFSTLWRKALKIKKTENLWIVLDGPVDAVWIENLNSVLDDNKTLTLANGDRIVMASNSKLVFEPDNVDNASPATVSRMGMVFMSASILPWQPILQSWLLKRPHSESSLFGLLFDRIFTDLMNFIKINTSPKMFTMESMAIKQATDILVGLIPTKDVAGANKQEKSMTNVHLEHFFLFSLMWSAGALLEIGDREKLQEFFLTHESGLDWPKINFGETVFEYTVNPTGQWEHWSKFVEEFDFPSDSVPEFASILVPNVDNVRTNFLISLIAKQERGVLLIGEQGTAKTVMIKKYMNAFNPDLQISKQLNFSSATTPNLFQRSIESMVDKRMGTTYGPPRGRKMVIFIDDINMPDINDWGDQVTNEIVRQLVEMRGVYSLDKPGEFNFIVDVQLMAAMIHPGGGRNDIPHRLKRHFSIFNCTLPSEASMDKIFSVIGSGYFCPSRFDADIVEFIPKLVPLTRVLWQGTKVKMLPTPAKFHYVFNLRDLSRIWEGILKVRKKECHDIGTLMSLWKHECCRVIADRFTNQDDRDWFEKHIQTTTFDEMGEEMEALLPADPHWVSFMKDPEDLMEPGMGDEDDIPDYPNIYEPVISFDIVKERLNLFMEQYNEQVRGSKLDMVFFGDAMLHILRISRIIRTDRGCAMLVGVGGSGKQSLTKLSSFLGGYEYFQIILTRSYSTSNLMEDLKTLFKIAGQKGRGVSFMFSDNDIKDEGFLEYINNVLCSGEVANLIPREEIDEICNDLIMPMKKEFPKRQPTPDTLYEYFISRVRKNLHVVLCFSPVGEKFRQRSLKFPGLVSGCTLDWFSRWPKDALIAVSRHFLGPFPIVCPGETKTQLIDLMGTIHDQVAATCVEYYDRFRRQTHVTPKSYLSFLAGYKSIYRDRRKYFENLSKRMDAGLLKLQDAGSQVAGLSKDLEVMERNLAVASAQAEAVLAEVTVVAEAAQIVKDEVKTVKDKAEELVEIISVEKVKAEKQLEKAKPALDEAAAALQTIKPSDISTVRKLGKPPHLIMRIMDAVLIYFYKKLDPYTIDPEKKCPKPSWGEAMKLLNNINFLSLLKEFPLDTINGELLELMDPVTSMEDYNYDNAKRVCGDVAGLCSWTRALGAYYSVNKVVLPLKMNLAQSEGKLAKANKELAAAQQTLGAKEEELNKATAIYDKAMTSKQVLVDDANRVKKKMSLASDLINGLAGERERWTDQSKGFKSQIIRLTGDVILLTGFLSYTGPFNSEFRNMLLNSWRGEIKKRRIPCSVDLNIMNMLVEPHVVGEWSLFGLPSDELSVQNGIIVCKASRYPLLIDPQMQGKYWIKNMEKENDLQITSQSHKYFRNTLESCLSDGKPLMIEDVGEELDPVLDNILDKNFIKAGTLLKVKLGDSEIEVSHDFRLFLTTKLPNPAYTPEVSARTSIIDFTVTMKGLEDQLLGRVIKTEKEELESERVALVEAVTSNRKKMQELEENLLMKLSSIQGSLLDDESLVDVLNTTKLTAIDVKEKLYVAAETEKKINAAREEFRPIATRGSILYFLICDMAMVNCMYQTSLNQFLDVFDISMEKSEHTPHTLKRIQFITEYLTHESFRYSVRGFYEPHKFMFVLLMALKIDLQRGNLKHNEFQTLIKGGAALDLNAVQQKPASWIMDPTWLNLVELSNTIPKFSNICNQVSKNERFWKAWFDKAAPEEETVPDGYEKSLDAFQRLLLIRSWCPDRIINQAKKYVAASLGPRFAAPVILSFDGMWQESKPKSPLCCFLSMGSDPTTQIETLARRAHVPCKAISMGQGQEIHARALLSTFMAEGGWVLLQNCHLGLKFMSELNLTIADAENPHSAFRLWLTTEVHCKFSISLLQTCIKFTNDPPQGIKAGLKRTYSSLAPETLDYTNAPQWRPMLFAISFLHSVVQERRKFGALGWNIPYEFNWADWAACVQFFQNHLDDIDPKRGVSWITIRYMVGEVHYGGRVTDDYDKRLLLTFARLWFNEGILQEGFQLSDGYSIPKFKSMEENLRFIEELPAGEAPGVYGLHNNAGITYQSNEAKDMLDTILSIQPKDAGQGAGESREAVEIDRMQKVLKIVRQTLSDLRLAIEGTIILNESLRDALDCMYDAKVPGFWLRYSWQSQSIGFWFTELLERNIQFSKWLNKGRPNLFWMTGFFNAQGFLTAMKQEVTRAHKGWALDQVAMHNEVLKQTKEEVGSAAPAEGVYIYGLFLDGAGWDKNQVRLIESQPKVLFAPLPVVHIYATDNIKPKDCSLYECPVYKKPGRTLLNFIAPIWLKSLKPPDHWTIRGVASLCDTK